MTEIKQVVDNYRILHGRSAFTGARRMCGAYIGADEFQSRLRVLKESTNRGSPVAAHDERPARGIWEAGL